MGDGVPNRRQKHSLRRKFILFSFILLGLIAVIGMSNYTLPQLSRLITNQWYISPLASGFSLQTLSEETITEPTLRQKLKKSGFDVKNITLGEQSFIVLLETGEKVILSSEKPLAEQISSLQLISSRFTIEGKHFVSLDLRFDRPVLVAK